MRLYGSFAKIDKEQRVVAGYASTEATDAHGETILKSAIEAALDGYLEFPAVRQIHQLDAVGKTIEATVDDRGLYIECKIVDDTAWTKITEGVFMGFSVGGKILARDKDDKTVITKIRLDEISLVDRPSNPEAKIDLWKAAGAEVDPVTKANAALDAIEGKIDRLMNPGPADALMKIFEAQAAEIDRLTKLVDDLQKAPLPAKTYGANLFKAISKEEDARGGGRDSEASIEDAELLLAELSEEDRALLLIKASHRLPRPVTSTQ
jgi:HK97 family phage prohead protease